MASISRVRKLALCPYCNEEIAGEKIASERFVLNVYLTAKTNATTPLNMAMFSCSNCKKLLGFAPLVAADSAYFNYGFVHL